MEFISRSPHRFYKNGKVHFAPAAYSVRVRAVGFFDAKRHVFKHFFKQSVAKVTCGNELALFAGKRTVVDGKGHFDGRFGNFDERNGLHEVRRTNRIAYGNVFKSAYTYYVAGFGAFYRYAVEPLYLINAYQFARTFLAADIVIAGFYVLIDGARAAFNPADTYSADVFVIVD